MEGPVDYSKHYQQLMTKHGHVTKPDDDEYYERHHVTPKSLGGADTEDNLVYLTGKAHYVAHYLLFKIHGTGPMSHAFWLMAVMDNNGHRHVPNSRSFEAARKAWVSSISGENNHMYGKTHTAEVKAKLRAGAVGREHSPEARAKISAAGRRRPHKLANIYCVYTDKVVAEGVSLTRWCKLNGYTRSGMLMTTKADRTKPSSATNRCHHKGIYATYIN